MTFEDFLDMMSVFSDGAPKNVKVEYAFRIYGMTTIHLYLAVLYTLYVYILIHIFKWYI